MDNDTITKQLPSRVWPRVATFVSIVGAIGMGFYAIYANYEHWLTLLVAGAVVVALNVWYHRHKSMDLNRVMGVIETALKR